MLPVMCHLPVRHCPIDKSLVCPSPGTYKTGVKPTIDVNSCVAVLIWVFIETILLPWIESGVSGLAVTTFCHFSLGHLSRVKKSTPNGVKSADALESNNHRVFRLFHIHEKFLLN